MSIDYWSNKDVRRFSVISLLSFTVLGGVGLFLDLSYPRMSPPPYYIWGTGMLLFSIVYVHYFRKREIPGREVHLPLWAVAFRKPYDRYLLGLMAWTVAVAIMLAALLLSMLRTL